MKKQSVSPALPLSLTNSQSKKATLWNREIYNTIAKVSPVAAEHPLEVLLEKYHKDNPEVLKAAINAEKDEITPLRLACELCTKNIKPEYEAQILPLIKKSISLLLKFGADPNGGSVHVFNVLFSVLKSDLPLKYEFKYADVVNELIDKGADLGVILRNQMTIAHYAAALDRKRVILNRVLQAKPELIDAKDSMGEKPLTTAIRYGNSAAALELLTRYKPEIDALNNSEGSALCAAIYFVNPVLAETLLKRGAGVHFALQMVLKERDDDDHKKMIVALLKILAKSGALLPIRDPLGLRDYIQPYLKINIQKTTELFLILEDAVTKKEEIILTLESLAKTRIQLSPEKIKRIHESFLQLIQYYELKGEGSLLTLRKAHQALSAKYPMPHDLKVDIVATIKSEPKESSLGLEYIDSILGDVNKMPSLSAEVSLGMLSRVREIVARSVDVSYSQDELRKLIKEYSASALKIFVSRLGREQSDEFQKFFSKTNYYFLLAVAHRYVEAATTREELLSVHDDLLFFTSLAASYILRTDSKSIDVCLNSISMYIKKYEELGIPSKTTIDFVLVNQILKMRMYTDFKFYPSVLGLMDEILANHEVMLEHYKRIYKKDSARSGADVFVNLDKVLNITLQDMSKNPIDLVLWTRILIKAQALAKDFSLEKTEVACETHRDALEKQWQAKLVSEKIIPLESKDTGGFKLNYHQGNLRVVLKDEISKTKAKYLFQLMDYIHQDSAGYFIPVYGSSLDEIHQAVNGLKSIDFAAVIKSEKLTALPQASSQEPGISDQDLMAKYQSAPSTQVGSSSSSSLKPIVLKQKEKAKSLAEKRAAQDALRDRVKGEIAQTHGVNENVVFQINHPHFPEDKSLHAWAVWGEIRGERRGVDDKTLEEHRATAEAGRFCAKQGQQGLKSVRVVDPITGAYLWSIKTKRLGAKGDPRVVAVPEDFHSATLNGDIKVYNFGVLTFHK